MPVSAAGGIFPHPPARLKQKVERDEHGGKHVLLKVHSESVEMQMLQPGQTLLPQRRGAARRPTKVAFST